MKLSRFFVLFLLLSAMVSGTALADDNDPIFDLRHHIDLPQPALHGDDLGIFAVGYHFTLFTVWNRVAFGGVGTGFGVDPYEGPDGKRKWEPLYYLELPIADLSMLRGGFDNDGDAAFEFTSAVLRELRYGSWGFRALFSVGWQ